MTEVYFSLYLEQNEMKKNCTEESIIACAWWLSSHFFHLMPGIVN